MTDVFLKIYENLYNGIISLQKEEKELNSKMQALQSEAQSKSNALFQKTKEDILKIEEEINYISTTYLEPAKRHSKLFGYMPSPKRIDEVALRKLYVDMDKDSPEIAQELQKRCKDTICFYEMQIKELKSSYERRREGFDDAYKNGQEAQNINRRLKEIKDKYVLFANGPEIQNLASKIRECTDSFKVNKQTQYQNISIPLNDTAFFSFGYVKCLYPIGEEYENRLKDVFGEYYDESDKTILLPLCYSGRRNEIGQYNTVNISISFDEANIDRVYKISQGIIFNILRCYKSLPRRIVYIDPSTYNPEHLDYFSRFVGENNLISFPKTINEAKKSLQMLEETAMSEPEENRQKRYLFVHITDNLNGDVSEIIKKIANNCKKNNITTIFLKHKAEQKSINSISNIASVIDFYSENGSFFTSRYESAKKCVFFDSPHSIDSISETNLLKSYEQKKVDNKYESYNSLKDVEYLKEGSIRTRCKNITVPYGLDRTKSKNSKEINSLTFEKTDFATFIMGASGSGKSTLIHSIITGIIKNYHPDEVELWLADFKLSEFAPYAQQEKTPPHIKYIVMDSSHEIIYDFIDLMIKELRRRQVRLAELRANDRNETDVEEYMPAIFVIIDEFSALSEAVLENDSYKRKLDELLSRGRSNGFRFIFASQAYTDGASALSSFAKKQIQSRIAMKNTVDEIKETLSIPASQMSETDRLMIDELPKYYALHKQEKDGGGYRLTKSLVMYFENTGLSDWESRHEMIKYIKDNMKPINKADRSEALKKDPSLKNDPSRYVYKDPVFITSDHLIVFNQENFLNNEKSLRSNEDFSLFEDDKIVSFGMPRVLMNNSCIYLSNSARENIFLLTNKDELPCSMSVAFSAIRSFAEQDGNIQIWGHKRNKLFRRYMNSHFSKFDCYEDKEMIGWAMDKIINNIRNKIPGNDLIVLLGMDRIYEEFSDDMGSNPFDDISYSTSNYKPVDIDKLKATTPEEIEKAKLVQQDVSALEPLMMEFYERGESEGKTEEQIDEEWWKFVDEFMDKKFAAVEHQTVNEDNAQNTNENEAEMSSESEHKQSDSSESSVEKKEKEQTVPIKKRNYAKDFSTLVQIGSRYGYHFLVVVDDYRQLSDMGLNLNVFNHRLAFCTDSTDTSQLIFNSSRAAKLNNHICFYNGFGQSKDKYLITPYLHKGIYWESWRVDEDGNAFKLYT